MTTFTYDVMDRRATRTDALNRMEFYEYDPNDNLVQFADRKGQVSTFSYDALNRRTSMQYADGSSMSFTYDSAGRLADDHETVFDHLHEFAGVGGLLDHVRNHIEDANKGFTVLLEVLDRKSTGGK